MVKTRKLREPLEDRKGSLFFDGCSVKELANNMIHHCTWSARNASETIIIAFMML